MNHPPAIKAQRARIEEEKKTLALVETFFFMKVYDCSAGCLLLSVSLQQIVQFNTS